MTVILEMCATNVTIETNRAINFWVESHFFWFSDVFHPIKYNTVLLPYNAANKNLKAL